MFTSQLYQSQI